MRRDRAVGTQTITPHATTGRDTPYCSAISFSDGNWSPTFNSATIRPTVNLVGQAGRAFAGSLGASVAEAVGFDMAAAALRPRR